MQMPLPQATPTYDSSDGTPALQIAAVILILNAITVVGDGMMGSGHTGPLKSSSFVPAFIDLYLAWGMLKGEDRYRGYAIARAALGLVIFGIIYVAANNYVAAVVQVAYCASLIALLAGKPSRLRVGIAATVASLCFAFVGLGLYMVSTGQNPLGMPVTVAGGLSDEAVTDIKGTAIPYSMKVPAGDWHRRPAEAAKKDSPDCDAWIVDASHDAHVMVIAERLPNVTNGVDVEKLADLVLENNKKHGPVEILARRPLMNGLLLETRTKIGSVSLHKYIGVYSRGSIIAQVHAWAADSSFGDISTALYDSLASFQIADAAQPVANAE